MTDRTPNHSMTASPERSMSSEDIVGMIWPVISDILPSGPYPSEISNQKNRAFLEAILWLAESGGDWDQLPDRFGSRCALYQRFNRWTRKGVWEKMFVALREHDQMPLAFDGRRITIPRRNARGGLRLTRRNFRRSACARL